VRGLKGYLSSVWISIEQSVMVSGIVYVFLRFVIRSIDNYRTFNYLSDFAENQLKDVYMYQDDTWEIISQSDHSFNSYNQKSKCSLYVYHWMRLIRFRVKI